MNFKLPFTESSLTDMIGKTFVLASNFRGNSEYHFIKEIIVGEDGQCNDGISFRVMNGALFMFDRKSLFAKFSETGTNGHAVFALGYSTHEVSKTGFERFVLYEKILLSSVSLGICISSHVDYEKKTLPVIVKSLNNTGFDKSRVLIVIGGDKRNDGTESVEDGILVVRKSVQSMGFNSLNETTKIPGMDYWLLLHDTCEFEKDFVEKIKNIDIGLHQDVITLRQGSEMGLYGTHFIRSCGIEFGTTVYDGLPVVLRAANTMTAFDNHDTGKEKDIYGDGNKRKIIILPVGVKKYEGRRARGGKP